MPNNKPRRRSKIDDGAMTMTLEQYKAAQAARDIEALRRTGTDISAHTSAPERTQNQSSGE